MNISAKLDQLHLQARGNKWLYIFAIFLRFALAFGFITSGMVKVWGERFTVLPVSHPMGNYLEALFHTGYYYTVIGVMQVTAAVLLLFPRTALLGAVIYFPIILNICILSLSVRFEGSFVSSPLMVFANLYLLCWYYHKWKYILPINRPSVENELPQWKDLSSKFPFKFFAGSFGAVAMVFLVFFYGYDIMPRNTTRDCLSQCEDSPNPQACRDFCDCIHKQGQPLKKCLDAYHVALPE
ncbi:hypothetical protein [Rufibacter roseus]|uniref:DoxX family protein n=1 Tax=Rufibacter roseus TaxID=1567108 RepID=A0ABW2DN84_9BACT|nr:hypothetical protein [Rufibacter roseus]